MAECVTLMQPKINVQGKVCTVREMGEVVWHAKLAKPLKIRRITCYTMDSCARDAQDMYKQMKETFSTWNLQPGSVSQLISLGKPCRSLPELLSLIKKNDTIDGKFRPASIYMVFIDGRGLESDNWYAQIKQMLAEKGIPSQFINMTKQRKLQRERGKICTQVCVQMLAKLGRSPWVPEMGPAVKPKLNTPGNKGIFVVGIDTFHAPLIRKPDGSTQKRSVAGIGGFWLTGGRVPQMNLCGSAVEHRARQEVMERGRGIANSTEMGQDALKQFCLDAFKMAKSLPTHLVVFRDGVAVMQEDAVRVGELAQVNEAVKEFGRGQQMCSVSFVIARKRIKQAMYDTRGVDGLKARAASNAPSGAVVTAPTMVRDPKKEWYLFSLGTSPSTARSVHYSTVQGGLDQRTLQELAFAFSHTHFTWQGPVLVPGPTQYGHHAAQLVGENFNRALKVKFHNGLLYL
ncbi:hypothetical protein KIPB_007568 [Kipferlia bialata]|uniref:Piwi domain-containing protein n=1 Tax=Kipferlia bialata TaxID=797122 RepID=A0A9K3CZE9_9EUKA|nr:hypothetical protein KIPB_007568 [Kipferlia bialata]|eukprot:g7568.t1